MEQIEALLTKGITTEEVNILSEQIINKYSLSLSLDEVSQAFIELERFINASGLEGIPPPHNSKYKFSFVLSYALTKHQDLFTAIILAPKLLYLLRNLRYFYVPEEQYGNYAPEPEKIQIDNHHAHATTMFLLAFHPFDMTGLTKYSDTPEMFKQFASMQSSSGNRTKPALTK